MGSTKFTDSLPPNARLLWYEIIKVLGKGGFGITYQARDTNLNQMVAIKEYLPSSFAARSDSGVVPNSPEDAKKFEWGLDRFLKEAQILARFRHPGIVRIMSFFRDSNTAYIVMEYEDGESLENILKIRNVLTEREMIRLLPPLLDALELLHRSDYLHRDIKPANILIRKNGTPVILDFGSARQAVTGRSEQMTSLLTMGYSPFEQYDSSGARQGPWSDIYAMGGVLYRAISGKKPIDASMRVMAKMRQEADPMIPAAEVGQGRYTPTFLQAVDKALQVMEGDRPQSVAEWRIALGAAKPAETAVTTARPAAAQLPVLPVEETRQSTTTTSATATSATAASSQQQKKNSWRSFIASMQDFGTSYKGNNKVAASVAVANKTAAVSATEAAPIPAVATSVSSLAPPSAPVAPPPPLRQERVAGMVWTEPMTQIDFVWMPSGQFLMGSTKESLGRRPDEMPQHLVELDGFWIGRYPITIGQWKRIVGDPKGGYQPTKESYPVERVLWEDTQEFSRKFSRMTGGRLQLRLPTEAEWEYAARAGSTTAFYFGDDPNQLDHYGWHLKNSGGHSQPVGQKKPNLWGLHDMLGNVWEWTSDWYSEEYYGRSPRRNPGGAAVGEARVRRGGSWRSQVGACRVAHRNRVVSESDSVAQGFRMVCIDSGEDGA
ncbi:MAG: SUMF1/EgtB/PvdO family nonheme iron enzyme [Magnetococcales bacterium]|nr:SUMF1/EgtB/PvdO family nonheme iron enzyme [Magnetococcales bacterium]